ncbi:MAG: hypothetical protein FWG98_08705 [Candidatus Cloacimonetes bacterium]|nr:hypothetical protein [Candidatus Cloacimonadota bacterium]
MTKKHNLLWHRVIRSDVQIDLKDEVRDLQIPLLSVENVKVYAQYRVNKKVFCDWDMLD